MKRSFYDILNVPSYCNQQELTQAYHRVASENHPATNPDNDEAQHKFTDSALAFDVLRDPKKRTFYDKHEDKFQLTPYAAPRRDGNHARDLFQQFFCKGDIDFGLSPAAEFDPFDDFDFLPTKRARGAVRPAVQYRLELTLDELYSGAIKTFLVNDRQVTVKVGRGWKDGQQVHIHDQAGIIVPYSQPADVIVTIQEKPHPFYRREGDDLIVRSSVSLREAMSGSYSFQLPFLCGEEKQVDLKNQIISHGSSKILLGSGMPNALLGEKNGNLVIEFQVRFPDSLTANQRAEIFEILSEDPSQPIPTSDTNDVNDADSDSANSRPSSPSSTLSSISSFSASASSPSPSVASATGYPHRSLSLRHSQPSSASADLSSEPLSCNQTSAPQSNQDNSQIPTFEPSSSSPPPQSSSLELDTTSFSPTYRTCSSDYTDFQE
eukprot:TRINITY_DN8286_c0_g1::TRINITY_DN8286_c0_g1_i1::g.10311::m.10311 TRINITY_DN8286_c0_g1::TRINITY_DN8286_c0_g1_i1::g.10311  ORF type:complete len:435 (+),score=26.65,sp/Q5BIP8/DNJB5_BOVIN/28.65/4e-34,DnaJ/PF00226.26/8e-16,CTDII/PF01556.13/35,CTDII/PF01556.13/4.5e-11 TRINITY_DN8286_c0_g1_i1:3-1307(+)